VKGFNSGAESVITVPSRTCILIAGHIVSNSHINISIVFIKSSFIRYSYISPIISLNLPTLVPTNIITSYLQANVSKRVRPIPVPKVMVQRPCLQNDKSDKEHVNLDAEQHLRGRVGSVNASRKNACYSSDRQIRNQKKVGG
jgi:hypothetical protein